MRLQTFFYYFFLTPNTKEIQPNAQYHQNQHNNNKSLFQTPETEYAADRRIESSQYPVL